MKIDIQRINDFFIKIKDKAESLLRVVVLPGFHGMPLYDVLSYFIHGFTKGYLLDRAAAVAFNVFLAIFPSIMVLFTLLPYLPLQDIQVVLVDTIVDFLPETVADKVVNTITEIISLQHNGLLSIGVIMAFYFSSGAIRAFFRGFDMGVNHVGEIKGVKVYLYGLLVTLLIGCLLIVSISAIIIGSNVIPWFFSKIHFYNKFVILLLNFCRWLLTVFSLLASVAILYHFGNPRREKFKLFTPGSIVFSAMFIIGTLGFNYYIVNFSRYNALYGSIGVLIIFLLWLYVNCIIVLIGYELNASIVVAERNVRRLEEKCSGGIEDRNDDGL
ncbi:MAG: YihY/virulence factor BrkB family protein [Candidatus Limimorpha sp.]